MLVATAGVATPAGAASFAETVEPGVVVLFVPLCALVIAIIAEAVRLVLRHDPPQPRPARAPARRIIAWTTPASDG